MAHKVHQLFKPFALLLVAALSFLLLFLAYAYVFRVSIVDNGKLSCFRFASTADRKAHVEPYRLFGTKTTYLTARQEIRKVFNAQWPLNGSQCSPHYLFFLNRHSIRYPSVKEIRKFKALLPALRDQLIAGGKLSRIVFKELFNWKLLMNEVDENHVSLSGKLETAITAQIFYKYFPSLLDIDKVNFEVGVTPKIRTNETANAFIRSLVELQIGKKATSIKESNELVEDVIQQKFANEEKDILMTHKKCKKMMEKNPPPKNPPEYDRFAQSEAFTDLLNAFSVRNGLTFTLTFDTLVVVYRVCSYELAINRYSPWCQLFTNSELQVLDYLMDISEYFDAYGTEAHRQLACTVIGDLYTKLESAVNQTTDSPKNATLYFSHENLLSKVISYLELFKHFPDYDHSGERLCLPQNREWHSSLAVPFGTNFAAVLYRCGQENNQTARPNFKLLTLLNEIPVKIRGCNSELCDIEHFFAAHRNATQTCDLNAICR